jgi:4'-phosphopantetheinyl transferase
MVEAHMAIEASCAEFKRRFDSRREVHAWVCSLEVAQDKLADFEATLWPTERERAARFHFDKHRHRFITGRGLLRMILGGYLQNEPASIEFVYGPQGKPALGGALAKSGLNFNLSHSESLGVIALTRAGSLGVDVERVRSLEDVEELVRRFFSARESAAFRELADGNRAEAFFNLWTRKEAWLKATGEGIAHSLNLVEVSFLRGEPARLLGLPYGFGRSEEWSLHSFCPALGFAAAIAVAAPESEVRQWKWPGTQGTWEAGSDEE